MLAGLLAGCARDPDTLFRLAKSQYEHGDMVLARTNARAGYERYRNQPQSEWHWNFRLQWAGMLLDNGDTDAALNLLENAPAAHLTDALPRYQMLKGHAFYRKRQNSAAHELLELAVAGAAHSSDGELQADVLLRRGLCALRYEGDSRAARNDFEAALKIAEARRLNFPLIAALNNLGDLEVRREHYGDAFPYLDRARRVSKEAGFEILQSRVLGNIADCYQNLGETDKALKVLQETVNIETKSHLATALTESYSNFGSIYLEKGDAVKAVEYLRKALAQVDSKNAPAQYGPAAARLAQALEKTGALDEAERYNQAGLQATGSDDAAALAILMLNQAAIEVHRKQFDLAKTAYEKVIKLSQSIPSALWAAHAGSAALYADSGDFENANLHYERALQVIEANRADQLQSEYKIAFLNDLIRLYQDYVELLVRQNKPDKALEVADSSRASVLTEALLGKSEARRRQLTNEVQRAAKAGKCIFLFYWLAPKRSYVWAITGTGATIVPLPERQQIDRDVQSYRTLIEERRDPLVLSSPAGQRLFRALIGPIEKLIPKGGRVVVVPDGSLHSINFETLIPDGPQPHYWLEDVTVSIAPSLGILQAGNHERLTQKASPAILLMGDPVTDGTGFPRLPEALKEIERVERHFPGVEQTVYTREKATPEAYGASAPGRFSAVHFATHVEPNEQSPLDSAIILSAGTNGYRLYARDVAELPLKADLVTISACRGAGTRTLSGEGLVGFAWAFFQAGAHNVVTSLWDANDRSTTELMDRFYAGVEAGKAYSGSLRAAKLWMLRSKYEKPYYWAPFQLYSLSIDRGTMGPAKTPETTSLTWESDEEGVKAFGKTSHINR